MALSVRCVPLGFRVEWGAFAPWLATLALSAELVTGCSSPTPGNPDGSASGDASTHADRSSNDAEEEASETSTDVVITDDTVTDASSADATPIPDGDGDGDARCACSYVDSGFPPLPRNGVLSIPCYCEMPWSGFTPKLPCVTYDEAAACRAPFQQPFTILTYTNCDFITVGMYGGLVLDERHYEAKTHEFVGARRWVDHSVLCGAEMVLEIQTGILPGIECEVAGRIDPCADGGGRDAEVSDAELLDGG
jgi:hypothetical protein